MSNLKYQYMDNIQTEHDAVVFIAEFLTSESFLDGDEDDEDDFWDDIVEFCKKWGIPFNVNLHQQIRQVAREKYGYDSWKSSSVSC